MQFKHLEEVPYFLEYSPDLKVKPVSDWTLVNLTIQLKSLSLFKFQFQQSLDLNPGDYGPWN